MRSALLAAPIVTIWLWGCALEDTGTYNGVGAADGLPYSGGGTGGYLTGEGGASVGGGSSLAICGNGMLDRGEVCDVGDGETPPRNLCVGCQLDAVQLYSVAGTTTPPSVVDGEGRLHLYYLTNLHTFEDAAISCAITGAYLATIRNDTEAEVVTELLGSEPGWAGAQDQGSPQWTSGEPWGYLPSGGYVPGGLTDSCVVFDPVAQQLRASSCAELERGICEWIAPGSP